MPPARSLALVAAFAAAACTARAQAPHPAPAETGTQTWYTFNGDLRAQKYAAAAQITPENVGSLRVAWSLHTGDVSDGAGKVPTTAWSATPLFVNDTVYVSTPFYRVFAIEPDTGKTKWVFDSHSALQGLTQTELKTRGVAYWQAEHPAPGEACQKIVYLGTMDARIFAVDADSGKPCTGFGQNGALNVNQWNTVNAKYPFSMLQPPTVYKNTLFFGWAGKDWEYQVNPPGLVFAVDAQTGTLKWTFHAVPDEALSRTGKINVWASMSVDPEHNLLYFPTSPPSPDDWGGNRKEPLPFGNAIVAVNADTGAVVWSRQLAHHELWDFDMDSAPVLVDLDKDGQKIPALVESTKQGYIFVLNRLTGEPVYPIAEKPVPQSDVPGEQTSPTQPEAALPEPTVAQHWPGVWPLADIASFGACSRQAARLRNDGPFTPPSLRGSLTFPASAGGVEWGGGAVDPATQTYVVNSSDVVQVYQLIPRQQYDALTKNGTPEGFHPMAGAPYGIHLYNFTNWLAMPCWKPPFGTLSAYDLRSGKLLWKEPFGEVQKYGFYMPESWGSVTIGAPVITKSGLIFLGGSMDSRVRALDVRSGHVLWRAQVDAPAVSIPAVFDYKGKEYVVFTAGGNSILEPKVSDQLVAFALPG
jgi:quinoprotein glucose dehydrogenase